MLQNENTVQMNYPMVYILTKLIYYLTRNPN